MSTLRRKKIPSRWWFDQMRKAVGETNIPTTTQKTGVPESQLVLASKLTADPNDDVQHRTEVSRGDWE